MRLLERSNNAELSCLFSVLLLNVPEAVSSHTKTRSRSAVQSIPSLAPCCPRGSLVPYQSEEHQFCGALLTEVTVCGMNQDRVGPSLLSRSTLFTFCTLLYTLNRGTGSVDEGDTLWGGDAKFGSESGLANERPRTDHVT